MFDAFSTVINYYQIKIGIVCLELDMEYYLYYIKHHKIKIMTIVVVGP